MSVVARRIRSTPVRAASTTWMTIVDLIAPDASEAREDLLGIQGIASSIIATEAPSEAPIVVRGHGPRIRFYCLYGEDATTGETADEGRLAVCPTSGDWHLSLPAEPADLEWIQAALSGRSSRIEVRNKNENVLMDQEDRRDDGAAGTVDREAFLKP